MAAVAANSRCGGISSSDGRPLWAPRPDLCLRTGAALTLSCKQTKAASIRMCLFTKHAQVGRSLLTSFINDPTPRRRRRTTIPSTLGEIWAAQPHFLWESKLEWLHL